MSTGTSTWKCYLLLSTGPPPTHSYVGVTPELDRRLAQHNGILRGGAAATAGRSWRRVCHVTAFPDQRAALQFEWAWKHRSKRYKGGEPLTRRLRALQELLADSRPTAEAALYETYSTPLEVIWEAEGEMPTL